jgi:CheY-like chemotaxis protein
LKADCYLLNQGSDVSELLNWVQEHRLFFDAMHAAGSVISVFGWLVSLAILATAWWRGWIKGFKIFGAEVTLAHEAVVAATRATRERILRDPSAAISRRRIDLDEIRKTVGRAFLPEVASKLVGRAVLWVDDNPHHNTYEAIALRMIGLVVQQVTSTEAALEALKGEMFNLVISDMGRGSDKLAGYVLLDAIRSLGNPIPFIIYSSSDAEEHKREAQRRGAQGSTNDPRDLLAMVIAILGK